MPIFVARGLPVPRRDCFAQGVPRPAFSRKWRQAEAMANPFQFIQDVRSEARKIVWPTRRETMITSSMVILMVVLASLFFVIVDSALRFGVKLMLTIGH
jgi:preprotein translocase subunit SecE